MTDKKLIRVELIYDDGSKMWQEGEAACKQWLDRVASLEGLYASRGWAQAELPPWQMYQRGTLKPAGER